MNRRRESKSVLRVLAGLGFFVGTCAAGVVGYRFAGWSTIDAVYMVIISIFGVGYGEVRPVDTPELRTFTMSLIVAGYGAAIYAVGGFVQLVAEGEINKAMGARRMTRDIEKLEEHAILCGYGRVGRILAKELAQAGSPLVVIDREREKIAEAENDGHLVVSGDAASESVLRQAGIEKAAYLAAVLPSDAANVFVTLTATDLSRNVLVIARAEDPASESKLRRSGAEHVILPAAIGAERIGSLIMRPTVEGFLASHGELRGGLGEEIAKIGLRMEELTLPPGCPLSGRTIDTIEIGGNHGFLIVGLRRADGTVTVDPDDDTTLFDGDTVIVVGHSNDLPELRRRYELKREVYYRGARLS